MREREIVVFRYRKGLRLGAIEASEAGKVRILVDKQKSFQVPEDNILLATGLTARNQGELDQFGRRVEDLASSIDLREVWELASADGAPLAFKDITDLSASGAPDAAWQAALLFHLDDCPFFRCEDERYHPQDAGDVEARLRRAERHKREEEEEDAFLAWLGGKDSELTVGAMSDRQLAWLGRAKSLVIQGDDWPLAAAAKELLSRVPGMRGDVRRRTFQLLVDRGVFSATEHLDLLRLAVPVDFPPEVEAAAAAPLAPAAGSENGARLDLTERWVFSIDDETTEDVDDAFSLVRTDGGFELGIHITDLCDVVPAGSLLDATAAERASSLYFPERKIPMLPLAISAGNASLLAGETRPCVSLLVHLDDGLVPREVKFARSAIINRRRCTYDEICAILGGSGAPESPDAPEQLREVLGVLDRFAAALRRRRAEQGAFDLDQPEVEVSVGEDGEVSIRVRPRESPAQTLVSELMILYNREAAAFCRDRGIPVIYRTQSGPSSRPPENDEPALHPSYRRYRYLRACPPADLRTEPGSHSTLGLDVYSQFTSPIRRYLDLVHQRQLAAFLERGAPAAGAEEIAAVLQRTEERLRELRRLEPDRERYWILKHLKGSIGKSFPAVVFEAGDRPALVEVLDYALRTTLAPGAPVKPGDVVSLRLVHVDPWDGTLRFALD